MQQFFTNSTRAVLTLVAATLLAGVVAASGIQPWQRQPSADSAEPVEAVTVEAGRVEAEGHSDDEALRIEVQYDGFDPDVDYISIMIQSCLCGDAETGRKAAKARNKKIETLDMPVQPIDYDELAELSKIITSEAGSSWLPLEWKMRVGEVVLNRVASPEFPDTIYEVVHQKKPSVQYANVDGSYYKRLLPYRDCVVAATKLLSGERLINDRSVVYQSQHRQGSGVYMAMFDSYYGYTYLCYSSNPKLYVTED